MGPDEVQDLKKVSAFNMSFKYRLGEEVSHRTCPRLKWVVCCRELSESRPAGPPDVVYRLTACLRTHSGAQLADCRVFEHELQAWVEPDEWEDPDEDEPDGN